MEEILSVIMCAPPGAGGFDALFALYIGDSLKGINETIQKLLPHACILPVKESIEGLIT